MVKARLKFHSEHDASCVLYKNNFLYELRAKFAPKIENPIADNDYLSVFQEGKKLWKHVGDEKVWVTRPQFHHLEGENIYHWNSKVTFVRMYERQSALIPSFSLSAQGERRLMVLQMDVLWKSKVGNDGRFLEGDITAHEEAELSFNVPADEELQRWDSSKASNRQHLKAKQSAAVLRKGANQRSSRIPNKAQLKQRHRRLDSGPLMISNTFLASPKQGVPKNRGENSSSRITKNRLL